MIKNYHNQVLQKLKNPLTDLKKIVPFIGLIMTVSNRQ